MAQERSIPSLDGLRALSVLLVILYHSTDAWVGHSEYFLYPLRDGLLGVSCFFVISGFLITSLLLKEKTKRGSINLGRFYVRRAFRIFPPLYVYLAIVGVGGLLGISSVSLGTYLFSALYLVDYNIFPGSLPTNHMWSLSVEEQFYLIWPLCLLFFRKMMSLRIAIAVILLSPAVRVISRLVFPSADILHMFHTRVDTIMIGCVLALALDLKVWPRLIEIISRSDVALMAGIYLLFINSYVALHPSGGWTLVVGMTSQGVCCAIVILYAITHAQTPFGRFLNHPVARHIGVISYSLYLWQQLFTVAGPLSRFPWNFLPIFICAELSYFVVERPSFYLRDKLLKRLARQS